MTRTRDPLHDGWRLYDAGLDDDAPLGRVDIDAEVPGVVHLDLLGSGLIPDPYLDRNEETQHWIGRSRWRYRRSGPLSDTVAAAIADGAERIDLVFDGLDTLARVSVGGSEIGATANQHRRYRFDVTEAASAAADSGALEVAVEFDAPVLEAERLAGERGPLPTTYDTPFNYLRKMACNFGWDWGPQLTTSGIWRPVALECWSTARLASVRPTARVDDDGTGDLTVDVDLERLAADSPVHAAVAVAPGAASATVEVSVPDVRRWWPVGYGDPSLYQLAVTLTTADGEEVDRHDASVGFRNVAIDTTPVDDGTRWAITVNGERIWVRGVNWIPDDCFPSRVGADRLAHRLGQALEANVNLIRIWGGGLYESDEFYDFCDRHGLLVWQDFPFACATYDEDLLVDEVRAEAVDNIDRLMGHPSLALWNGNNENLWGWWAWGWPAQVGERSWGEGFYRRLLPALVAERDPARPYVEGSPSSGSPDRHPNDQDHGPMHIWTVWNEIDYLRYRDFTPRFVAEFGYQAPATWSTTAAAITSRPLAVDNPDLDHHQKAKDGHAKLARGLATHFADPEKLTSPEDFDRWLYLTQLNQARALTVGIGHLRRLHQRCAGAVMWQLNDCWPVVSWAVVDGEGRRKPSWYALRRVFDDHLLVVEPDGDGLAVFSINDGAAPWAGALTVRRFGFDGRVRVERSFDIEVPGRGADKLLLPAELGSPDRAEAELLVVDLGDRRAVHTWVRDRDLDVTKPGYRTVVERSSETTEVVVTADTVVRDLCLFPDRLDPEAEVDSMLVTLLPGERHRFVVDRDVAVDDEALVTSPVLVSIDACLG